MEGRKADAVGIAINAVNEIFVCTVEAKQAQDDIISVLKEAQQYFIDQENPAAKTLADNFPSGYREPLCQECAIYKDIKEELVSGLLDACEAVANDLDGYTAMSHATAQILDAAIAKARGEE